VAHDPAGPYPDPVASSPNAALVRVRAICTSLPEVTERPSHGAPTWFVRDQKSFVACWYQGHHDDTFPHMVCAAAPGVQAELIAADPQRYFRPPYVGHRGWIGVRLDGTVDWIEMAEICHDAYRAVAPARLVKLLDEGEG
jgi:hypothetical protein